MKNIFNGLNINDGDKVLVSSDILRLLMKLDKGGEKLNPDFIIDMLIEKVGKHGTLMFPTFNWDFCKGVEFNYKKTMSLCGALANTALKRKDFLRTKNPIYSFAVTGKDKNLICNMKHNNSFSLDSPFGYLIKNKGKNLFIDLHYRVGGFPFVHLAEQQVGVKYRYLKTFNGFYIDASNNKSKVNYSMYVRDPSSKVAKTFIHEKFDNILKKVNAYKEVFMEEISLTLIDIEKAYNLLVDDLKNDGDLIYTKKTN